MNTKRANNILSRDSGQLLDDPTLAKFTPYRTQEGSTIPHDLLSGYCVSVNQVCRFMQTLTDVYLTVAKRILCYIKETLEFGLTFHASEWAGDHDDRISTTGGPNLLSWMSEKKSIVSWSNTHGNRILSTRHHHKRIKMVLLVVTRFRRSSSLSDRSRLNLWSSTIYVIHARTRHHEVDYLKIFARSDLYIHHVSTDEQVADIFTKSLPPDSFFRDQI